MIWRSFRTSTRSWPMTVLSLGSVHRGRSRSLRRIALQNRVFFHSFMEASNILRFSGILFLVHIKRERKRITNAYAKHYMTD